MPEELKSAPNNKDTNSGSNNNCVHIANIIKYDNNKKEDTTSTPKKRLESMSEEEIIQQNLNELLDKKSRDERKANGRFIAVILSFLVIYLAIYHVWISQIGALGGVLIPATIMLAYAGWVVILAKRDKRKKAIFDKHLEEVISKNKAELEEKAAKLKQKKSKKATLHFKNEINVRKHKQNDEGGGGGVGGSNGKKIHTKRPSIREKLFRQKPTMSVTATTAATATNLLLQMQKTCEDSGPHAVHIIVQPKKKRLQRLDALIPPRPLERISSAP